MYYASSLIKSGLDFGAGLSCGSKDFRFLGGRRGGARVIKEALYL